jgi:hypothetical protein
MSCHMLFICLHLSGSNGAEGGGGGDLKQDSVSQHSIRIDPDHKVDPYPFLSKTCICINLLAAAECPGDLVHTDCYPNTCEAATVCTSTKHPPPTSCPPAVSQRVCLPGCFCPAGSLRQGDKCLQPSHCKNCKYRQYYYCEQLF